MHPNCTCTIAETDFTKFSAPVQDRYNKMAKHELFVVDVPNIFEEYLAAFPEGTNPVKKERTTYDCSACRQFITRLGVVVQINDVGELFTIWDGYDEMPYPFNVVAHHLSELVKSSEISHIFRTPEGAFGCTHNFDAEGHRYNHFFGKVASRHQSSHAGAIISKVQGDVQVFKRGLAEISAESLATVVDLIEANSLYRGEEHLAAVKGFRGLHGEYQRITDPQHRIAFCVHKRDAVGARIRNTSIGTLLLDLSNGEELEAAVRKFETIVAPANYKRPRALITQRMVQDAEHTLNELGLSDALARRVARIEDVSVNDVLFVDRSVRPKMKGGLSDLLKNDVKPSKRKSKSAEATVISGEEFLARVVPKSKKLEILFENKHLGNLMALTAPVHENAGRLFKWDNDFAWSYDGEVADAVKVRVKAAGGNVDAYFRTSLAWYNRDDLDIHVITPFDFEIFFGRKYDPVTGGRLDVDMNVRGESRTPVENVCWDRRSLKDGVYQIIIVNYLKRESIDVGFELELEFAGSTHQFFYSKPVYTRVNALCVEVKNGEMVRFWCPDSDVISTPKSVTKWGISTGENIQVDALMLSPNHWGSQCVGNKHVFFISNAIKNPDPVRGIYNEYLRADLTQHRKVFEILGSRAKAEPSDDGLCGLGFSSTRKDEVTITADGRPYVVKF